MMYVCIKLDRVGDTVVDTLEKIKKLQQYVGLTSPERILLNVPGATGSIKLIALDALRILHRAV